MANFDFSKLSIAVDLGGSKIKGVIGFVNESGKFVCLTSEQEKSAGISHGYVKNISEAAGGVKSLMTKLTNRLTNLLKKENLFPEGCRLSIEKVYVSISAAYTQGVFKKIERNLPHLEVTEDIINDIQKENDDYSRTAYTSYDKDFFMAIPQSYELDGCVEHNPVGCVCNHLAVVFQNIVIRKDLLTNIKTCFERAGYPNVEFRLAPIAMSNAVLTTQEKNDGAVLIDFGAHDTSISVFQDAELKYVYILPKGSNRITEDLQELKMPTENAQLIKQNGCAMRGIEEPCGFTMMVYGEERYFDSELIADIIEHRLDKIYDQVRQVISYAPLKRPINQIVMVGGGSNLKYIKEKTEASFGISTRLGSVVDMDDNSSIRSYAAVLGTLYDANGGSVLVKSMEEEPVVQNTRKQSSTVKPVDKLKNLMGSLFDSMFQDQTNEQSDQM